MITLNAIQFLFCKFFSIPYSFDDIQFERKKTDFFQVGFHPLKVRINRYKKNIYLLFLPIEQHTRSSKSEGDRWVCSLVRKKVLYHFQVFALVNELLIYENSSGLSSNVRARDKTA